MLLSVITPTLNPGPQLERAIMSVLHQDFHEFEHLIVDGGSTDSTLELLRKYGHLRIFSEPDEGIFDAMNTGIALSKGEWIYFLGADDVLADKIVFKDMAQYLAGDCDVVYGDVVSSRFGGRYGGPFDMMKILKRNICHQAVFFRRAVFEKVGTFDTAYTSHADWDHNMRWLLNPEIRKQYVDRVIADYADYGYSSVNPDSGFNRDRLYRYLSYGRRGLPRQMYTALWCKELLLGIHHLDLPRVRRTIRLVAGR